MISAVTDPFAAILAPTGGVPGGDAATGVTGGATTGKGTFGTMLAPAATTTPPLAAMPSTFRGTLLATSLPLDTLVSAGVSTGMPMAEPTTAPANCFVQPAEDMIVTVEPTGQMAQPMTNPAASTRPSPPLRTPTALPGDEAVAPTPILRSATIATLQSAASTAPLPSTQPSALRVVPTPVNPTMPDVVAPQPELAAPVMPDVQPAPAKSILPTAAARTSATPPVAVPTTEPSIDRPLVEAYRSAPVSRATSTALGSMVPPSVTDAPQPPEPVAQVPVSAKTPMPQLETSPDQPVDDVAAAPFDTAPTVSATPIQRASLPADASPVMSGEGGDVTRLKAASKPAVAPKPTLPATGAAPMPVTLASVETATPVAVKPAPTGKVAAGEPAPAEEQPATDGDDAGTPVGAAMPGQIVADIPVPPPVTGSGQADAAPVTGQDGGRHQTTAAVAAAPAAVTPPIGGAVATDRVDPKPAAASPAIASGLRAVRDEATSADARPAIAARAAAPDTPAFANLVEQKAAPVAAAPAAQPAPVPEARVPAEPGRMGHGMAVAIARHTAEGGGEALTVRLNPAEFGRIDVTLSFDDRGTLRAVLAAETPAALDMLRRDSADLGRALSDAGMRTDAQSFRFDTRQGGADAGGQGAPGGHRWQPGATPRTAATATNETAQPEYRPLRTRGGVDLMA